MRCGDGDDHLVSLHMLTVTADNPAKEALLNLKSTACGICEQEPVFMDNVAGMASIATFPYLQPPAQIRTPASLLADATRALDGDLEEAHGIHGPTPLMLINDVDPVMPIDYSHNVCLRVVAKSLTLWFDPKHKDEPWSAHGHLAQFDLLMTNVRPPSFITRPPRPYSSHAGHWKAVEFRAFLLYYGPIVLRGILKEGQYRHFLLLSCGVALLLGRSITPAQLQQADLMLKEYVRRFPQLYHQRFMSRTIHSLIHLALCVRKTGPLWVASCFPFESVYHYVRLLIHGTRFVLQQVGFILFSFSVFFFYLFLSLFFIYFILILIFISSSLQLRHSGYIFRQVRVL